MMKMWLRESMTLCVSAVLLAMLVGLAPTAARHAWPREIQNWYFPRVKDTIPMLERIKRCLCPRVYIPVCATNKQSYVNVCRMNCYNSVYSKNVEIAYMGHCEDDFITFDTLDTYDAAILILSTIVQPIVSQAMTVTPRNSNRTTTRQYDRLLPPIDKLMPCEQCPNVYLPVCTKKLKTYQNVCYFNCLRTNRDKVVRRGICMHYK